MTSFTNINITASFKFILNHSLVVEQINLKEIKYSKQKNNKKI